MRKELEYHKVNKTKLKQVKDLIEQIAQKKDNVKEALCKLHEITGKEYKESDFYEYWGFMDLEDFAKLISVQEPPLVRDLTREELIEIIETMEKALIDVDESKLWYYEELLHKSLPLSDPINYITLEDNYEKIADNMLQDAKRSIIYL